MSVTGAGIPKVRIPAGTFLMGSPESEPYRFDDEKQHEVMLTREFYMSKYEIANAQYAAFLNAGGIGADGKADVVGYCNRTLVYPYSRGVAYDDGAWKPQAGYENRQIVCVTWYGATAYAAWTGGSLPTEAQWEYACRVLRGGGWSDDDGAAARPFAPASIPITTPVTSASGWCSSADVDGIMCYELRSLPKLARIGGLSATVRQLKKATDKWQNFCLTSLYSSV